MTIPFLDVLLPQIAARSASNGPGPADSSGFGALLAGLEAGQAVVLPEPPLALLSAIQPPVGKALPETAVPPIGKALPGAKLPPTGKALPDDLGTLGDERLNEPAIDPAVPDTDDQPVQSDEIEAIPVAVATAGAGPANTVATLVAAGAAIPIPAPVNATTTNRPEADAADQQPVAVTLSTRQPTPRDVRKTARGEQLAVRSGQVPSPMTNTEAPPASVPSAPSGRDAPISAASTTPALTILPPGAQSRGVRSVAADAPTPSRRGQESRLSLLALPGTPETAPAAFVAASVSVLPVGPDGAAAAAPAQPAAQPIALPDHRALVEALVRARADRDPGVSVALETREFGAVALRFETLHSAAGERGLQVAVSSGDPGFERAVASAAAAQAALADQSGRNPANRSDQLPARSADASSNPSGDAQSGRTASSDPQSQHRPGAAETWREPRSRQSAELPPQDAERPFAPRAERRGGSIFA